MLSRSILFNFKLGIVVFLCITLTIVPSNVSYGERLLEQYGDKVTVSAEITRVKINYKGGFADFNDPGGFNTGEVAVLYSFSEPSHANILETELNLDGWDLQLHDSVPTGAASRYKQSINQQLADHTKYTHVECHPLGTLNTVFTVYNVNGRWPNWEGILVDTAKAASFATLRQLAIEVGYVAAEGATMGGLLVAAVGAVIVQNIIYTIRGNESLGVGTLEVDLQELGENGEQTYTVTTAETQFGNAEIDFVVRTHTEDIPCSEVSSSHTSLSGEEFYAVLDDDLSPEVPGWIKQNAKWWSDGTISDADFALGIGFLVKEGIIAAKVESDRSGTILVNENLRIPIWIKQNAKWWSEGAISDSDFTSGIEFMVKQRIITFSEPPRTSNVKMDKEMQNYLLGVFTASKWNEAAMASLANLNDAEGRLLQDLAVETWEEYDDSKDPQVMQEAKSLELLLKNQQSNKQQIKVFDLLAKKSSTQLKSIAKKQGVTLSDLSKIEKTVQSKAGKLLKITNADQLKEGLDKAKKLDKEATFVSGKNPLSPLNSPDIEDDEILSLLSEFSGESLAALPKNNELSKAVTIEDKIMMLLLKVAEQMDAKIAEQAEKVNDIQSGQKSSDGKNIDIETMQLKRLIEKRGQLFDICRQIIDKYDETAKSSIQGIGEARRTNAQTAPQTESTETTPQTQNTKQIVVLVISGKYYPLSQFFEVQAHQPNCDSLHYHSEFSKVRSIDGTTIPDPNPSTCGFGKVGLLPMDVVDVTQEQIDSFKAAMGFEP
ncbi:MAG: hypothetical protein ACT4OD_05925 [Candidatus Nitrosotenuis sp.]